MKNKHISFILFVFIFLLHDCVAFHERPRVISRFGEIKLTEAHIVFTGFLAYETEQKILLETLKQNNIMDSSSSPILLEIILEETDPNYPHRFLHTINWIVSIVSLTIIPYHIQTEHQIRYQIRKEGTLVSEHTLHTKLDQLRGVTMLPLTYFFWPSNQFQKSIANTVSVLKENQK